MHTLFTDHTVRIALRVLNRSIYSTVIHKENGLAKNLLREKITNLIINNLLTDPIISIKKKSNQMIKKIVKDFLSAIKPNTKILWPF